MADQRLAVTVDHPGVGQGVFGSTDTLQHPARIVVIAAEVVNDAVAEQVLNRAAQRPHRHHVEQLVKRRRPGDIAGRMPAH